MKINWAQKLTSRKLWLAVAGLFVGVLALFGTDANTTEQISGVILSLGSVVAYIVGEGLVDAASAGAPNVTVDGTAAGQAATAKADTAPSPESGAVAPGTTGAA